MPSSSTSCQAKGSNFLGLLKAVEKLHGAAVCDHVVSSLPGELGSALRYQNLLAVAWYPASWYAELHSAIDRKVCGGPELARKLGRAATSDDFSGLHRRLISMLRTETVFGHAPRLMNLYWKGGTIELVDMTRGHALLRFVHWDDFNQLVWEDIMGSVEAILDICGASRAVCRPLRRVEAAHSADLEARWS